MFQFVGRFGIYFGKIAILSLKIDREKKFTQYNLSWIDAINKQTTPPPYSIYFKNKVEVLFSKKALSRKNIGFIIDIRKKNNYILLFTKTQFNKIKFFKVLNVGVFFLKDNFCTYKNEYQQNMLSQHTLTYPVVEIHLNINTLKIL